MMMNNFPPYTLEVAPTGQSAFFTCLYWVGSVPNTHFSVFHVLFNVCIVAVA